MSNRREHDREAVPVSTDLVEYFIVTVSDTDSLTLIGDALAELVRASAIRILDLVLLVKDGDGVVSALEPESVDSLRHLPIDVGDMLSDHDIDLAALALRRDSAAVVLVTEDRWAQPLSVAAQRAGGQILAGERIPAARVASSLARTSHAGPDGT